MKEKLVPRGPVLRWTGSTAASSSSLHNSTWESGRNVSSIEQRCGMLSTVREIQAKTQSSRDADTKAVVSAGRAPINFAIKGQHSDWQINDVSPTGSSPFALQHRPKGRWKKVRKEKQILVEENSQEEFHTPGKSFQALNRDLGEYKKLYGTLPAGKPLLRFLVYKEGYSTEAVLDRMRYEATIPQDAVFFAEPRDGFGCVTQLGTAVGVTREQLPHAARHHNINQLLFEPLEYIDASPEMVVPQVGGATFRAMLRCVDNDDGSVESAIDAVKETGFVNYFALPSFTVCENSTFDIAREMGKKDYFAASSMWLQCQAERNPKVHQHFLEYLAADSSTASGKLDSWIREMGNMKAWKELTQFLEVLRDGGRQLLNSDDGAASLFGQIGGTEKFVLAAQHFVWNAMVSQRLMGHGLRVVEGDVVWDESAGQYRHVGADETTKFGITDVVIPSFPTKSSVYPKTQASEELFWLFAKSHGFDSLFTEEFMQSQPLSYRPLIVKPQDVRTLSVYDPTSLAALKSDGALLQEKLSPFAGIEDRLRTPTPFNTSPYFNDVMEPVKRARPQGRHSVALECTLPPGSHMLSLLRELGRGDHINFSDLLTPSL